MCDASAFDLLETFARLRDDGSSETLPVGRDFWTRLGRGQLGNFHHEYLLSSQCYVADWAHWEMHPAGDEVVCLISGQVTMVVQRYGDEHEVMLTHPGQYLVVPRGTWHTARVQQAAQMLFITPGEGTQHRPVARPAEDASTYTRSPRRA